MHPPDRVSTPRKVGQQNFVILYTHPRSVLLEDNAYAIIMDSQTESIDISSIKATALRPLDEQVWIYPSRKSGQRSKPHANCAIPSCLRPILKIP